MHIEVAPIKAKEIVDGPQLTVPARFTKLLWLFLWLGVGLVAWGMSFSDPKEFWGAYYMNVIFWMGLAAGGVMASVIFQIVKAKWSIPIRRLFEAHSAFLPYAYCALLFSWFGKEYLFSWAQSPAPGKEWWMEPTFVYIRFAVLLGLLFWMMIKFVRMQLKSDVAMAREISSNPDRWAGYPYDTMAEGIKTSHCALEKTQCTASVRAPLIAVLYGFIYSLFAFEMVMGMDRYWYSTMFGGFTFVGNIYIAWAATAILMVYLAYNNPQFWKILRGQQLHDLGKLIFGFCMLWGYMFISQYLPIWYGNLPEETHWFLLRIREDPWRNISWLVLPMCFFIPFIMLAARDIKKNPMTLAVTALIPVVGVWLEKYLLVMPAVDPHHMPSWLMPIGLAVGFFGAYGLAVTGFLNKYPMVTISYNEIHGAEEH
jgi:hypothetical protein